MDDWYLKPYDRRLEMKTPVSKAGAYDSPGGLVSAVIARTGKFIRVGEFHRT